MLVIGSSFIIPKILHCLTLRSGENLNNMIEKEKIKKIEDIAREVHDLAGRKTQPVLSRYPLLFAFLLTFSIAAILHGFELWADSIALFTEHPTILMLIGIIVLGLTGTLYKSLQKLD